MLQSVDVGYRAIESYRGVAPDADLEQLRAATAELRGLRVLHLSATPYGGGVSELLRSTVPLLHDLGLVADWKIISGDNDFFEVTKKIHNGLQGADVELTPEDRRLYEETTRANAKALTSEYDVVFCHDPQPAAVLPFLAKRDSHWIWRCHIDTGQPNASVWDYCRGFLGEYDAAIFTMAEFAPPDLPVPKVDIIPPAIDPLSPKNMALAESTTRQVLDWIGVALNHPLVTQVSRFDLWKDPAGVIEAYKLVKKEMPYLQLALVGSMALDDPEGWRIYQEIKEAGDADPMIHIFTNLTGVGNVEVNAFQRMSDVIIQKSIREGFGLVISEALWKGTPVVAGRAGGIPLQMSDGIDGVGGILVESVEECATGILELLRDPDKGREMGAKGRERVREHFLLPRLLLNEVSLMREVLEGTTRQMLTVRGETRDLVCGMMIADPEQAVHVSHDGHDLIFCSDACKLRFHMNPRRYLKS